MDQFREIDVFKTEVTAEQMDQMREELAASFVDLGWHSVADEIRDLPKAGDDEWESRWIRCFMLQAWRLGLAGREFGKAVYDERSRKPTLIQAAAPREGDLVSYSMRNLAAYCATPLRIDPKGENAPPREGV